MFIGVSVTIGETLLMIYLLTFAILQRCVYCSRQSKASGMVMACTSRSETPQIRDIDA